MDLYKDHALEIIRNDINILRELMYKAKNCIGEMEDSLVIEISQFLDLKLNQQVELTKSLR